jgi:hypothetical protein
MASDPALKDETNNYSRDNLIFENTDICFLDILS